jgi:transposase
VDTVPVTARADLTDQQWAVLEPLLPKGRKPGRPPKWSKRQLIDGIRWRTRAGTPWRDVPALWAAADGLWPVSPLAVCRHLEADPGRVTGPCGRGRVDHLGCQCRFVDRSGAPACGRCPQKRGLQKETPGGVECGSTDHPLGRSRGEWTTKLHLGCEPGQRPPLSILVTAGQRGAPRSPQSSRASGYRAGGRAGPTPDRVLADKAYSATRAVATRFDKLAVRYQATLHIAAINEWLYPTYETRPS